MIQHEAQNRADRERMQQLSKNQSETSPIFSVVIPALNEEDGIAEIVTRILDTAPALGKAGIGELEVIVVDDGSKDGTSEGVVDVPDVDQYVEGMEGVRLIRHSSNRGYGAAIKTGFRHARGDLLAFLDADGTYPPEQFPELCRKVVEAGADVVVGSRRSGAASQMPMVRRLGNFVWSSLVASLYPLPDGLNFTPVMSTRCQHERLKVVELPIPYSERQGRSKLSVVRDGTRFLKTILWTSLEYNPVKVLGLVGASSFALSGLIGLGLILARLQGITTLGYWGVLSVFSALLLGVAGTSIYSLGVTFNFLVALFHRKPVRQGLLIGRAFKHSLESYFGAAGIAALAVGFALAASALVLGSAGWEMSRLWLWLLGSALFILVGLQLTISWVVARVLQALAERESLILRDLEEETSTPPAVQLPAVGKRSIPGIPGI